MAWDYTLSDLLMFTVEVFQRLYIRLNQDIWPWQWVVLAASIAIVPLLARPSFAARRLGIALLAVAWAGSGGGFLMTYYAPVNWPAEHAGIAFIVQSLLVLVVAGSTRFLPARLPVRSPAGLALITLWGLILLVLPWLSAIEAGDWRAVALFGLTPDLTALGWIVWSVLVSRTVRWLLLIFPLLWCLSSSILLWGLGAHLMMLVPVAGLLAGIAVLFANPSLSRE